MAFLKVCIPGYSDGFGRMDHAMEMRPIPPAPFPTRKGERMAFLKVCIQGYSDGVARIDHAMNPKKPIAISPFLVGRGPGGRSQKVKPEFIVNPGFSFVRVIVLRHQISVS